MSENEGGVGSVLQKGREILQEEEEGGEKR